MKTLEKNVPPKTFNYVRWVAVLSAFVLVLQIGLAIGWASPNFAWLVSEDSSIEATTSDVSWIASLTSIGSIVGAIVGSISMEHIGTRRTIILSYLLMGISWTCFLVADSVAWFYAGRIITAIPLAMIQGCFALFLGEISSPKIRGTLISLAITGSPLGAVLSTIAETYLSLKVSNSIYLAAVLIGVMMMLWLKDTPYFLMKKNDVEGAIKSIEFYHVDKETTSELEGIQSFVEKSDSKSLKDKVRELQSPVLRRSMLAIFFIWALPHLCGYGILVSYMEIILKSAKFNLVKPEEFVIYATVVKVLVAFTIVRLVDKLGRRLLLIISSVGTSVAMFALGLHFHLLNLGFDEKSLQWLPCCSIVMFLVVYPVGFSIVPNTILSEMFPEKAKSAAIFIGCMSGPIFGFIVTKAYQPIIDYAGQEYAFWVHSLLSLSGIPCAVFLMIETKGKSFQEIQNELTKKWHR